MDNQEIFSHIDHTQLKPYAAWQDIKKLCDEAVEYKTASVCIPPCYISRVHETYGDKVNICTVVGFPLGYQTTEAKVVETRQALADGASEIDMVINLGDLRSGRDETVLDEISALKRLCGDRVLKVIIETCLLTDDEKLRMCRIVTEAGADYIKTSTGFSTGGATREDVRLMRENVGTKVRVKAAGGISDLADAEDFIALGADRLGTSRVVKAVKALESAKK